MTIRYAQPNDIEQIIDLCAEHAAYEKTSYTRDNKAKLLATQLFAPDPVLKCVVAEEDRQLIGYTTFMKQFATWDAAFYVYMGCLYLRSQSRSKGVGVLLMEQIKLYAKAENCTEIQWQTPDFNVRAIAFYKRIGGEAKAKERFFWKV